MKLNQLLLAASLAVAVCLGADSALAQQGGGGQGGGRGGRGGGGPGGGNFDPAQMQQRMMDRVKEQLEITDDAEWKALQPLVQKVMDARMASFSGGRGMFGRGGGRAPGGDTAAADQTNQRRGGFGTPSPEAEALQKAIDAKASSSELKAAMAKNVESRKAKQAALEKAQAELIQVLTVRQQAILTASGTL